MAERLRWWITNPFCIAYMGSNPIGVGFFCFSIYIYYLLYDTTEHHKEDRVVQ